MSMHARVYGTKCETCDSEDQNDLWYHTGAYFWFSCDFTIIFYLIIPLCILD